MPTFNDKSIIETMLMSSGHYPGDPLAAVAIHEYRGMGGVCYHVAYSAMEEQALYESPYVANPVRLWSAREGLTAAGSRLIEKRKGEL
jgi:hypothetical protein